MPAIPTTYGPPGRLATGAGKKQTKSPLTMLVRGLESIRGNKDHLSKSDITLLFRSLATMVDSGVSLAKSLEALAEERSMDRAKQTLLDLRRRMERGASFSAALAAHPHSFDRVTVSQVRVGERAGTLVATLDHIAEHREKAGKLRAEVTKKLAYPCLLVLVGAGVIAFLLTYVVPVFEETYQSANVPLPSVTLLLIAVGHVAQTYGVYLVLALFAAGVTAAQLRKNESTALSMDRQVLRLPLIGHWLRDIAILEFMDVLANLLGSGYTLADSLAEARETVGNRAVKLCVKDLHSDVESGERFSRSVEHHSELFPPMISQLVIVGERTGNLLSAARHIKRHLEGEVERKANTMVGIIEPVLTLSLSAAVAVILLAIYLPMFDMINTVGG